jgi:MFS transporter, DHA1 family, multidrug resistance protein
MPPYVAVLIFGRTWIVISASWAARLVVFVAFFDLFSQFPIIAPFARSLGADPLMIGLAVAAYNATNLIGNLSTPLVLQRWGRKRSLVAGLLLAALSLVLYGQVTSPLQFALVRAVHGAAQAILSPGAFVVLSDAVPAARRPRAMGLAGVFIAVAAVIAPPISGVIADRTDPRTVFLLVAGMLTLVATTVGVFAPLARTETGTERPRARVSWMAMLEVWRRPALITAYTGALTWTAGIGSLVVHLPLLLESQGAPASTRGGAFGVYAIVALVMMAGPAPWLATRFGRLPPLVGGLAAVGISLVWLAADSSLPSVYGAMGFFGLGFGALFPAATALVADASRPHERAAAYGVFYAAYSLGVIIGQVGSGQMARVLGVDSPVPFLAYGTLALLVAPILLLVARTSQPWPVPSAAPSQSRSAV